MFLFKQPNIPDAVGPDDFIAAQLNEIDEHDPIVIGPRWREDFEYFHRSSFDDFGYDVEEQDRVDYVEYRYANSCSQTVCRLDWVYVRRPYYRRYTDQFVIESGLTEQGQHINRCLQDGFTWNVYDQDIAAKDTEIYWRHRLSLASNLTIFDLRKRQSDVVNSVTRLLASPCCNSSLHAVLAANLERAQFCFEHQVYWSEDTGEVDIERSRRYWSCLLDFKSQDDPCINRLEKVSRVPGLESLWSEVVLRKMLIEEDI